MVSVSPGKELRKLNTTHSKLFKRLNSTAVMSTVIASSICLSFLANVSDIAQAAALGNRFGNLLINFLGVWFAAFDRADRNCRSFECTSASDDHQEILGARERHVDAPVVLHEFTADFTGANQ